MYFTVRSFSSFIGTPCFRVFNTFFAPSMLAGASFISAITRFMSPSVSSTSWFILLMASIRFEIRRGSRRSSLLRLVASINLQFLSVVNL